MRFGPDLSCVPGLLLALAATLPSTAAASNCDDFPALPEFVDTPCLLLVDRSVDPLVRLIWTHPEAELGLIPPGESQELHLIVFSERPDPLPLWLSEAQVAEVREKYPDPIVDDSCYIGEQDPETILETSQALAGKWHPVNTDPIPVDSLGGAHDWDTSGLPPGTYYLYGYVESGRYSTWGHYQGIITIVDDADDPERVEPGLFLENLSLEQSLLVGQQHLVHGCAYAPAGSEIDVEWSKSVFMPELPTWEPVASCLPLEERSFQVPFVLPLELAGESVQLRAELRDPLGREAAAETQFRVVSTAVCMDPADATDQECAEFVPADLDGFPDDRCEGADPGDDTDGQGDGGAAGMGDGCGCGGSPGAPGLGLLFPILMRRRRRR